MSRIQKNDGILVCRMWMGCGNFHSAAGLADTWRIQPLRTDKSLGHTWVQSRAISTTSALKPHPGSLPLFSNYCLLGCTWCPLAWELLQQLIRLCIRQGCAASCWSKHPVVGYLIGHFHCSSEEQHGSDVPHLRSHRQVACGHRGPSPGTLSAPCP